MINGRAQLVLSGVKQFCLRKKKDVNDKKKYAILFDCLHRRMVIWFALKDLLHQEV